MMRSRDFLSAFRNLPLGTLDDLTDGAPFVILSPHPDDETLGAGGLIAAACARNQHVEVVLITDGAGSHPNSRAYPPERLSRLRREELERAGSILGLPVTRLTCLGLPDTRAPTVGPVFEMAVDHIGKIVQRVGARTVFVTWKHDPHCDHAATAVMAAELIKRNDGIKLWSYPIWGWHIEGNDVLEALPPSGFRVDIAPWQSIKQAAIDAHRSQMTDLISDDPAAFCFTPATLAPFLGPYEYFLETPL